MECVESLPPKRYYLSPLEPMIFFFILFGKGVFASGLALNPTSVLIKDRQGENTHIYKGDRDGHLKMKAETGVMQLQTQLKPPEAGRGQDSFLAPIKGAQSCEHLDFRFLASRTLRE